MIGQGEMRASGGEIKAGCMEQVLCAEGCKALHSMAGRRQCPILQTAVARDGL